MLKSTHLVSYLLVTSTLVCFVSAQLQQQLQTSPEQQQLTSQLLSNNITAPAVTAPTCNSIATKPATETKKFVYQTCIVAQLAAYLTIGQGQYIELKNGKVNTNSSTCDNATLSVEPQLVIDFDCGSLSFSISHTNDSKTFVKAINGRYDLNSTITTFANSNASFYTTQSGHYYKCNAEQSILVKKDPPQNLVLSNFALEAYRDATGTDFYQIPEECALDSQPVSDLVRLGVGICLIALVAIVLIAYFIGRRRWSERSSYESV